MRRRLKKARITHISLVPKGANQMPVLYKEDGEVELQSLVKEGEEGELLAIVYAPENEDSQGDIASAEVIKSMAYDAMKRGVEIDIRHDLKSLSKDQAYVAESFLVQKGDPRFEGLQDYQGNTLESLEGAWATVIKLEDEALREKYRNGEFNGVSMFGQAEVEQVKEEDAIDHLLSKLADRLSEPSHSEEIELTKEEVEALLAQREVDLFSKIDAKLEALKPEDPGVTIVGKEEDETEDLDLTDPQAVAKQIQKLQGEQLRKAVDTNDLDQMLKLQELLGEAPQVESRVSTLEKNLAQILKGSNAGPNTETPSRLPELTWSHTALAKSDVDHLRNADSLLAAMGYAPERN